MENLKVEISNFVKWCGLILAGFAIGGFVAWTLHLGYKWPTAVVGTLAIAIWAYLADGWNGYEIVIWGRDDRK